MIFITFISYIAYWHGKDHVSELDFIYEIHGELTKVPLALQDAQIASPVIHILGSHLLYSTTVTWLTSAVGFELCCVLKATLKLRKLTTNEMQVIYGLATRRLER